MLEQELKGMSLFAGMAGFDLGMKLALGDRYRSVCYVEIDPYCQRVLEVRMREGYLDPGPIWDDIRTFDGNPWRGYVDIVLGGFPCQDISAAGKGAGILEGNRSGLWFEMARVIGEIRPRYVLLENVSAILVRGADIVCGDLAEMGYDCQWGIVGARDVGAPHRRDRWWCLAYPSDYGQHRDEPPSDNEGQLSQDSEQSGGGRTGRATGCGVNMAHVDAAGLPDGSGQPLEQTGDTEPERLHHYTRPIFPPGPGESGLWERVLACEPSLEPAVRGVANGTPNRVGQLRALGNGIVPAVVAEFLRRIAHDQ